MAAPTKVDEFIDLVRKSGVVDEKRLDAYLQKLRADAKLPSELSKAAGCFVRDGVLTHFQAEQILQGKWRRFTIGKYKVLERLGSGGMGSVYLCEHKFMRRRVAVKVLPASKADDPASLERFYREARAVAALDHPNIVRAYDIDQDDKLHFLVMEHVDGASLQEIVKRHGPMDITRAAHYMKQSAVGLQHAHQAAGLVHRDIKPGNLLVDRAGTLKILDMGLARFFHDVEDSLTKKYDENVLGTADYLSPEQALDSHNVDIRTDIYSLGATFYFLLTGTPPFAEGTAAQKLIWHQNRKPKPVRSLRAEVPEGLAAVLEKMMAKDMAQRYQLPADVVKALAPWTQQPIPPPPEKEMPRLSPAAMGGGIAVSGADTAQTAGTRATGGGTPTPAAPRVPPATTGGASPQAVSTDSSASTVVPGLPPAPAKSPAIPGNGRSVDAADPQTADLSGSSDWELLAAAGNTPGQTSLDQRPAAKSWLRSLPPWLTTRLSPWVETRLSPWVEKYRKERWFWPAVGGTAGLLFFLFLILVIRLFSGGTPAPPKPPPVVATAAKHYVSQSGGVGTYKSIRLALQNARRGDRIIVQDEAIEEQLLLDDHANRYKDLVIEGNAQGKPVVWSYPAQLKGKEKFLELINVEGLHIKGFRFDGKGVAEHLINIQGACPGLTLEDLTLTGFTRSALTLWNCFGKGDEKISFQRLRCIAGGGEKTAVTFNDNTKQTPCHDLVFSDCRFEGPYDAAISMDGFVNDVDFRNNRFFNAKNAFLIKIKSVPGREQLQLTIESNTFQEIKTALFFEELPETKSNSQITLKNNLFVHTPVLLHSNKVKGPQLKDSAKFLFSVSGNCRDKTGRDPTPVLHADVEDFPPLPADVNKDDFLLYPKTSRLNQLADKPGVPPREP